MKCFHKGVLLLGIAAAAAGCDEDRITQLAGKLVYDEVVDFGDVQVGMRKTIGVEFTNEGGAVVDVTEVRFDGSIAGSRYQFEVPNEAFEVRAGSEERITVAFRPFEVMEMPAETIITLLVDGAERTLTLRGRGVESGLIVVPNPVDFGAVLIDGVETIDVEVTNALSETVEVFTDTRGGAVDVEVTSGTARFDVLVEPAANGSLGTLAPGESMTLPVRYVPMQISEARGDRARFRLTNCDFELCDIDVDLIGRGTDSALTCAPETIDFGAINPGRTRTATITCENVANDPIAVVRASLDLLSSREFTVQPISSTMLARGDTMPVVVTFAPTMATLGNTVMGTVIVEATNQGGDPLQPSQVTLSGTGGGPAVVVEPRLIDFGLVAVRTTNTRRILVSNPGFDDLVVSDIVADVAMTGAFTASPRTFVVAPGNAQVVDVVFEPQVDGSVSSALVLMTNDLSDPMPSVMLRGEGITLPPCAYTVSPPNINFGNVPLTEMPTRGFRVENVGNDVCLLNDLDFRPAPVAGDPFTLVNGPIAAPMMMQPGEFVDVPIAYQPTRIGTDTATVGFYISSVTNSNPVVPVFGVGEPLLQLTCPGTMTTAVGTPVSMTVVGQVAGANITGYQWNIVASPSGGVGTPNQWTPNPPTAATESFLALIVGTYDFRVDVFDDVGRMASCTTRVIATGEGLTVTLRWNGTGDVDLHLHNQVTTSPWFSSPNDCYYANRTPIWDPAFGAGLGANPELDVDNTSANGPENIRISTPVIGQPYTIAVHHYSSATGRIADLEIYCGGVTAPTYFNMSTMFTGTTGGNCTANEFWRVATVTFTSPSTCLVTPIDTYGTGSQACMSF